MNKIHFYKTKVILCLYITSKATQGIFTHYIDVKRIKQYQECCKMAQMSTWKTIKDIKFSFMHIILLFQFFIHCDDTGPYKKEESTKNSILLKRLKFFTLFLFRIWCTRLFSYWLPGVSVNAFLHPCFSFRCLKL